MATATGSLAGTSAGGWRAYATYTVTNTDTTATVTVKDIYCMPVNSDSDFDSGSSQTLTVGSNTASGYVMSAVHELYWYTSSSYTTKRSYTFTYNKTHAAQTKSIAFSVKLGTGWQIYNPSFGQKSIANTTSSVTISVTIPAKTSYTVTLNSNGGTGAAATLTKWYGEDLALPQPTKKYYSFGGWSGNGTTYTTTYTANSAATLTAVWNAAITSAHITDITAYRADSQGAADGTGTYVKIIADWEVKGAKAATVSINASMDTWTGTAQTTSKTASELTKTGQNEWLTTGIAQAESQYIATVSLTADNQSDTRSVVVSQAFITMDVLAGGHGIAFGKPATQELFDVGMDARFDKSVFMYNANGDKVELSVHQNGSEFQVELTDNTDTPLYRFFFSNYGNVGRWEWDAQTQTWVNRKYFLYGENPQPVETTTGVATAASGIVFDNAQATVWGKVCMLMLNAHSTSDISVPASGNLNDITLGTLAAAYRPAFNTAMHTHGDNAGAADGFINASNGNLYLYSCEGTGSARTISAGSVFGFRATYILA